MIATDVKCNECNHIYEVFKNKVLDDFDLGECPKCSSLSVSRIYGCSAMNVAIGKLGNSKNNFTTGPTYHPSSLTGKVKGERIK